MKLMKWTDKKIKKLTTCDISALKLYCVLIGMIIGAYTTNFVKTNLVFILVAVVILMVWLLYRFFRK